MTMSPKVSLWGVLQEYRVDGKYSRSQSLVYITYNKSD